MITMGNGDGVLQIYVSKMNKKVLFKYAQRTRHANTFTVIYRTKIKLFKGNK